jgi:hypothetical protein
LLPATTSPPPTRQHHDNGTPCAVYSKKESKNDSKNDSKKKILPTANLQRKSVKFNYLVIRYLGPCMTLAVFLLVISLTASALPGREHNAGTDPVSAAESVSLSLIQDQGTAPQTQNPSTSNSSKSAPSASVPAPASSTKNPPLTKRAHKKKVTTPDCNGASSPATSAGTASTPSGSASAASAAAQPKMAASTQNASTNCPPIKTIVPQGGSSEPSIQLVGGPEGEQAAQRDSANQLLGSTEENLKKIAGRQLSSNQQDMVNQIHQFMEQSKTAEAAGDLDRAQALAKKAQLLSQELVKPQP